MDALTIEELKADVAFLLARADAAGSCSFGGDRWTGASSNSLVTFAYGGEHKCMPGDRSDYAACVRTYLRLPPHRKTVSVREALKAARAAYLKRHPEDSCSIVRRDRRKKWEAERHKKWERQKAAFKRKMKRKFGT